MLLTSPPTPDPGLVSALRRARAERERILAGCADEPPSGRSLREMAELTKRIDELSSGNRT